MKKITVFQIVIAMIVIGVLAVGGFALYRLGFAKGAHAALPFEFGGKADPGFRESGGPDFDFRSSRDGLSLFQVIPGMLILTGLIVLITLGAVMLSRRFLFRQPVLAGQPHPPAEPSPSKETNPGNLE